MSERFLCTLKGHKVELQDNWKEAENNAHGDVFTIHPGLYFFATEENDFGPSEGFQSVRTVEVVTNPVMKMVSLIFKDKAGDVLYILSSEPQVP